MLEVAIKKYVAVYRLLDINKVEGGIGLVLVDKVCCSIWAVNFFVFAYSTISFTAHV